ncbi:MAG: hypothetical protein CSA22_05945 [Deltaproteobacteria bacterium]|nr:MAG: hypothetical protein CSA22_05945 [Deltaproteobacteria bacterium]
MTDFREISFGPRSRTQVWETVRHALLGGRVFKRLYVAVMLGCVGRSIQAASRLDPAVKKEVAQLPDGFTFCLGVMPKGPYMVVKKRSTGDLKYAGWNPGGTSIDVDMRIKHLEAAMLLFTFQESTAVANAHDRLIVDGDVPSACAVVRILDRVEVFLLPKLIASLAVKRYPDWPLTYTLWGRIRIYLRAVIGV